jgi:hypothetical protein
MAEYKPRYRWKETWPGETGMDGKPLQDFAAWDGELQFGRISLDETSLKKGQWIWAISYIPWTRKAVFPHHGWAPNARDASRLVEETYDKLKQMHGR